MIDTWSPWAVLIVLGGPYLLGAVGIAYSLYLGRHLDAMMDALKNSKYIYIWGPPLRKQGWFGCVMLVAKIAAMVTMPKVSIRIGELDPVDIENFPPHVKCLLIVKSVMLISTAVWMLVSYALLSDF